MSGSDQWIRNRDSPTAADAAGLSAKLDRLAKDHRVLFVVGLGDEAVSSSRVYTASRSPTDVSSDLTRDEALAVKDVLPQLRKAIGADHALVEWARGMSLAGFVVFVRDLNAENGKVRLNVVDRRVGMKEAGFPLLGAGTVRLTLPFFPESATRTDGY